MREAGEALERRKKYAGDRLRELRLQHGLKQKQLASIVSVDAQAVSNWERGVHFPDLSTLALVAEHFGVAVSLFFEESAMQPSEAEVSRLRKETAGLRADMNELRSAVARIEASLQALLRSQAEPGTPR